MNDQEHRRMMERRAKGGPDAPPGNSGVQGHRTWERKETEGNEELARILAQEISKLRTIPIHGAQESRKAKQTEYEKLNEVLEKIEEEVGKKLRAMEPWKLD